MANKELCGRIYINDSEIILSENPNAEYRYMVVENRFTEYYNKSGDNNLYTGHTNDYLEAIAEFTNRVRHNIDCVKTRCDMNVSFPLFCTINSINKKRPENTRKTGNYVIDLPQYI